MLKKRVIAVLTIKNNIVVQSIGFNKYLPVGKPEIAVEFLNNWGIDEIAFNDISATSQKQKPNFNLVSKVSKKCFVPLSVGGGITSAEDVRLLTKSGADKVIVNQLLLTAPSTVKEMCRQFGNQCIIGSVDIKKEGNNFRPYNYLTKEFIKDDIFEWLKKTEDLGVGELLLNFVDRDGAYSGFEVDLLNQIEKEIGIPIIALGGAKNAQSFIDLFEKTNVDAAAAGNFFHFTEHSVNTTKSQINKNKPEVRAEVHADYNGNPFDNNGRLLKKTDEALENMLFIKIEKEII